MRSPGVKAETSRLALTGPLFAAMMRLVNVRKPVRYRVLSHHAAHLDLSSADDGVAMKELDAALRRDGIEQLSIGRTVWACIVLMLSLVGALAIVLAKDTHPLRETPAGLGPTTPYWIGAACVNRWSLRALARFPSVRGVLTRKQEVRFTSPRFGRYLPQ